MKLFLLGVFLSMCLLLRLSEEYSLQRSKRSLADFVDIMLHINAATNGTRDPLDFNGYGCWCGDTDNNYFGASHDNIDACCKTHDYCYRKAKEIKGFFWACSPIWTSYAYSFNNGVVACEDEDNTSSNYNKCKRDLCECDQQVFNCFVGNATSYDSNKKVSSWKEQNC